MATEGKSDVSAPTAPSMARVVDRYAALSAEDKSDATCTLMLEWDPVEGATGYTVEVAEDAWVSAWVWNRHNVTGTSLLVPNLKHYTVYAVRVTAKNDVGETVGEVARGITTMQVEQSEKVWRHTAVELKKRLSESADSVEERRAAEVAAIREEIKSVTALLATKNTEVDKLQAQLAEAAEAVATGDVNTEALTAQTNDLKVRVEQLTAELDAARSSASHGTAEVEALKKHLADAQAMVAARDKELAAVKAAVAEGEAALASSSAEAADVEAELKAMSSRIAEVQTAHDQAVQRAEAADTKAKALEGDVTAAKAETAALQDQLAAARREADAARADGSSSSSRVSDLEAELFAVRTGMREAEGALQEANKAVEEQKKRATAAERALSAEQAQTAELRDAAARHASELRATKERADVAARQKEELLDRTQYLEEVVRRLEAEVAAAAASAPATVEQDARDHFRAHLPVSRLEEFMGHFRHLRGMDFPAPKAMAAVVKHPDSREMQVTFCLG